MSTGEYEFKRSLSQCVQNFETPACIEQVCYFSCASAICLYACISFGRRLWYDRFWRPPKIKLLILLSLSISTLFELVYQADFRQHWSYYTGVFFDDLYFVWVVYYFGKKGLNAMDYHKLLKYYKIALGVLVGLFTSYYIYNLVRDSENDTHRMCFDPWYTCSRVLVLILEFGLCVIGFFIRHTLTKKLSECRNYSHSQSIARLIKKNQKEMLILIALICIFFVSEIVLLVQAVIFEANESLNCEFYARDPLANFFTTFPIILIGYYTPRIYTIWVFRFNKSYGKSSRSKHSEEECDIVIQLGLRRLNSRSPALVEEYSPDNLNT